MRLDFELIPRPGIDGIFLRPEGVELKQNSNRFSGYQPTTDPNRDIHCPLSIVHCPFFEKILIFSKIDIAMRAEVRSEEEHLVGMLGLHGRGTGAEHSIDTAYAVAHFPGSLEDIIRMVHCPQQV